MEPTARLAKTYVHLRYDHEKDRHTGLQVRRRDNANYQ